ncbi:MAG: hypothetical protein K2X87_34775 [Gemmataceae bacterium]|nr:hypothetical protein [Gemmataceae bacterium]
MFRTMRRVVAGAVVFTAGVSAVAAAAPAKDPDPLPVESKWKGKLTQKGKIKGDEVPLDLDAVLTVTKRDGDKFEAELFEEGEPGIRLTYLVKGEVTKAKDGKGHAVEFKSYDFKDARSETFLNIPYKGTIDGKKLAGTWKHPPTDDDTTIEGDFTLELVK